MKKTVLLASICCASLFSFSQQNVGIGTNTPLTKLDVKGAVSLHEGPAITVTSPGAHGGANDNMVLPDITGTSDVASFYHITTFTGTPGNFSIYGIAPNAGANGQVVTLVNATGKVMTVVNANSSTAANNIYTPNGANLVDISTAGTTSSITLQYSLTAGGTGNPGWLVTATENYILPVGAIGGTSVSNNSTNNSLTTTVDGVTGTGVNIINSASNTWTQGGGLGTTINGVAGTAIVPGSGAITQVLGYNSSGVPVYQAVTSVGTTNYWTLSGSNLFNNSGTNVGIGTATPANTFSVGAGSPFQVGSTGAVSTTNNTASTSTTTGALVVTGGEGIGGSLNVGGTVTAGGSAVLGTGISGGYYQDATNGAYRSINPSSVTNGYYFQTNAGGATTMYVGLGGTYNGNVGIGTLTPGQKLTVVDAGNSNTYSGTLNVYPNNLTQGVSIGYAGVSALAGSLNLNSSGANALNIQNVGTGVVNIGAAGGAGQTSLNVTGYTVSNYFNSPDNAISTGVTGIMAKAGDNYFRTASAAAIATFLGTSLSGNYIINGTTAQTANYNITGNGVIGGTATVNGEIIGTLTSGSGQFRAVYGNYGAFIRNDGSDTYIPLLTASGSQYGGWNALRPLRVNDATGDIYAANSQIYMQHSTGDLGIGTTGPTAQLHTTGTVRFANYPGGLLGTDINGNLQTTSIAGTANQIDVTNGNAVSGSPTVAIDPSYTAQLKSQAIMTGGGTVTYSGGYLSWNARFIVINNGTGSQFSTNGYFDINQPPSGTVITGYGSTGNVTATASGIPVGCWEALYYIMPVGSSNASQNGNFVIAQYAAGFTVPSTWILIANNNCDDGSLRLGNGMTLIPGQSSNEGSGTYINNGTTAQSANFDITGYGYAANYLQSPNVYVGSERMQDANPYINLYSGNTGSGGIHLLRSDANSWGYFYADNSGIGILKDGSWAVRATGGVNGTNSDVSFFTNGGSLSAYFNSAGLYFNQSNPYINASSYFIAPGGAYFNGGTVYVQNAFEARSGVSNDAAGTLVLNGGTSGVTQWVNSYLQNDQGGTIELGGNNGTAGMGTPYIDFHTSGGGSLDYSIRQIAISNYRFDFDQTGYSSIEGGLGASFDMTTGRAAGLDLSLWTIYATRYGGYYDIMNDLDSIDKIRPMKWINPKTQKSETVTDVSSMPRDTKLKAEDGTYLTDLVNASYLNTGAVRQLRAETKSRDEMLESRIARLEGLVSQLTGKQLGEMEFTASGIAYKGIESFIVMDARITAKSTISVEGLSGYSIVNQGEGSFGIKFTTPPGDDVKFTYSAKY